MAVGLIPPDNLLAIDGIAMATCSAGLYTNKSRDDMVLFQLREGTSVAAVFTRNRFCAAPVIVAKDHLTRNNPRYLLINAGNANAGTGEQGLVDARKLCTSLAASCHCDLEQVLPFSTGVIGEYLPIDAMTSCLPALINGLSPDNWGMAAEAIMTTDTVAKAVSLQTEVGGKKVTFTGIAKGAGMIKPNMATMLAYVATDACIDNAILQQAVQQVVNKSFNRITVDGDTSTNDAFVVMATGTVGNEPVSTDEDKKRLFSCLDEICTWLAQAIVRDGEGASKFVTIHVQNGINSEDCLAIAYQVAHSPLVKTALNASDANWGRILAAVGSTEVDSIDIKQLTIWLDDVCIVTNGQRAPEYTEERGQAVMSGAEPVITIDLQSGTHSETVWTTDLSHDYVTINAEYRT